MSIPHTSRTRSRSGRFGRRKSFQAARLTCDSVLTSTRDHFKAKC